MASKRELILDLLARDRTAAATRSAAKNIDDVGDSADDAAKSTEKFSRTTADAAGETDKLGKAARENAGHVAKLDREIGLVENELGDLARAFARTDDAAERLDLSKAVRRLENDLRRLNKNKKTLEGLLPDPGKAAAAAAKVGTSIGEQLGDSATKALSKAGGPMVAVLAGVAIAAAPVIGATVAAAIIGGAGIGGVVGGVMLAARDSRVKSAGTLLGKIVLEDLESRGKVFVDPILKSIGTIRRGYAGMSGDLDRIFKNSSKFVQPLTQGVLGAVQRITAGIADLTDAAGPVIDVISTGVAELGDAAGDVFSDLKDNGVDAAVALNVVFQILEGTIRATGVIVNALTESFGFLAKMGAFGRDAQLEYLRLEGNARLAAAANEEVAATLGTVKEAGGGAARALTKLVDGFDAATRSTYGQRDAIIALNTTLRAQTDPVFGLLDAQRRLKEAQSATAKATRDHGKGSDEAKEALRRQATAILEVQGRAGELGAAFKGKLSPALRQTLRDGGMTSGQIDELEKQFREAKKSGDKFAKDYKATATLRMRVLGSTAANAALATARALAGFRAEGGPVKAGRAYVVGEKQAEVFVPDRDGKIVPSVEKYAKAGGMGGWSGAPAQPQTVRVVFDVTGAEGKHKAWLREMLRTGQLT